VTNYRASTEAELRATAAWIEANLHSMYQKLTDGGPLRIGELVRAAGDYYPEMLPNRAFREYDAALPPTDRSKIERDQALLVRALLNDPAIAASMLRHMRSPLSESPSYASSFDAEGRLVLDTVVVEKKGQRAEITLSNTATLNAETDQFARDLEIAVDVVSLTSDVTVAVLRGAEMEHPKYEGRRVFCAGINLKELAAGRISYLDFLIGREAGLLAKLLRGVYAPETGTNRTLPWIAAVDSFAIGGGMQLTLVCDHVITVDDAWLSLPAAREGIVPGVANLRLPSRVGPQLARELILFGRQVGGAEACEVGLVDAVVNSADVDKHVASIADALSEPAVAANKQMLTLGIEPEDKFAAYLASFAVVQADRMHASDVQRKLPGAR